MTVAPVCPVSRSQPVAGQPPLLRPSMPSATDLPSLIKAVNDATAILAREPSINNMPQPSFAQWLAVNNSSAQRGANVNVFMNWSETNRVTGDIYVWGQDDKGNPDSSQYVEVVRIYAITFMPGGSTMNMGMTWSWKPLDNEHSTP